MDQQVVIVDQFMAAMASIQEALASLDRKSVVSRVDHQQFRMRRRMTRIHLHHHYPFLQCPKPHPIYYTDILRSLHPLLSRPLSLMMLMRVWTTLISV